MLYCLHTYRFYPSKAKLIADKVVENKLNDKKSYNDNEAKVLSLEISNEIRQAVSRKYTYVISILYSLSFLTYMYTNT